MTAAAHDAEMMDRRYEIKMICSAQAYPLVLAHLATDRVPVYVAYPPRRVQSVYFDTADSGALTENLAGVSGRAKVRFRWYGREVRSVTGHLEQKIRSNALGWKRRVAIPVPVDVEGVPRDVFRTRLRDGLPSEWQARLSAAMMPVQWIAYDRDYYTTADGMVRLTLDRQLAVCEQRHARVLSSARPKPIASVLIVECKAGEQHYDRIRELLERFPVPIDKCSKFVIASEPYLGPAI